MMVSYLLFIIKPEHDTAQLTAHNLGHEQGRLSNCRQASSTKFLSGSAYSFDVNGFLTWTVSIHPVVHKVAPPLSLARLLLHFHYQSHQAPWGKTYDNSMSQEYCWLPMATDLKTAMEDSWECSQINQADKWCPPLKSLPAVAK